ncbi:MAG: MATE family efflux transporter, partial [Acidobacteriaceae bacterium]
MYSLKKLVVGSGSSLLRMVLLAGMGFFLMPFTIHKLGSEEYGIWATAIGFLGYYSFLDLGLSGAVFTHMAYALGREDHEEARDIYGAGIIIFSIVGLVLIAATVALAAGVF